MNFKIIEATVSDAAAISSLSLQLGYKITEADTVRVINAIAANSYEALYVVFIGDEVVAYMQLSCMLRIESGSFCEITALVVDEKRKGYGIGKSLISLAKKWCTEQQCNSLRLRTNVKRTQTHAFYSSAGFSLVKEQKVFEMNC